MTTSRSNSLYLFIACFLVFLTAAALADSDKIKLPYIGQQGQSPLEVTIGFLVLICI